MSVKRLSGESDQKHTCNKTLKGAVSEVLLNEFKVSEWNMAEYV